MKDFDVVIERDKETGQVYASVPSLPGCYSYADTIDELITNIKEAIELHLSTIKKTKSSSPASNVVGMVKVVL